MAEPLKDRVDRDLIVDLATRVARVHPPFDRDGFTAELADQLPALELKDRINLIADRLRAHLPEHYPDALAIIVAVAESRPGEWAGWPLCSFVERHGLDWPDESLHAMTTLTQVWSCEFAIRPYLDRHLDRTRKYLHGLTQHRLPTVRRLASEGTRPRLPWGPRVAALTEDPAIGLELIGELRHDPDEIVRRSVANHLNDVAKDDPELVVDLLADWVRDGVDSRMVSHALRSLVKQGHPAAMQLLGFTTVPQISIEAFTCRPGSVALGDQITLTAALRSTADTDQRLVVDFVIHHVNASGETSPKVFKWTTLELAAGEIVEIVKRRRIATASTRRYREGHHRIDLQVAGEITATTGFDLTESSADE